MATSVNYIQGNSLRIILPLMVIQLHEDGTTTEGSFVPLGGDVYAITLKGKRVYHYTPTIEEIDGENCAVFILSGVELCGTYSLELVVSREDGTRLRYANPDALTLEHFTGEVSGGTGGAPLIVGGVVLDPSLFIFAKGDKGDDGEDGVGIASITKTGTSGLVDTYTITYTNGNTSTFTVTNGRNGTDGTDGTDGVGVVSIVQTTTSTESGGINVITCTLTDGTVTTFEIRNGQDGGGGTIDPTPTQGSTNAVASGGVYDALQGKQDVPFIVSLVALYPTQTTADGLEYTVDKTASEITDAMQADRQIFVHIPAAIAATYGMAEMWMTAESIKDASRVQYSFFVQDTCFSGYLSPSYGMQGNQPCAYLEYKTYQQSLTFDNTPTDNSNNPVTSNGIYDALQGKVDTAQFNNFYPVIEDTRSSNAATITGVAPFANLVDGQHITLKLAYPSTSPCQINLTLSGGGTTGAKVLKSSVRGGVQVVGDNLLRAGQMVQCCYNADDGEWWLAGMIDTNTTYSVITDSEISTGTAEYARTVSAKVLRDNFPLKRTVVTTGSALTADTYLELGTTDTVAPTLPATYTDADEFIFSFTCDTAACSVTLPTGVVLADNCDNFSEVAAGVFFQVSIMDDVAAYLCVTPTT